MDVAREFIEGSLEPSLREPTLQPSEVPDSQKTQASPSSSYTLASDQSVFSRNVDRWIRGGLTPTESTGVQGNRLAFVQRSTLTTTTPSDSPGMWYILALMLPFLSANNTHRWGCSPSTILNTAELLLSHLRRVGSHVRCHIRRLAQNNISRELFATAMDIVLVIYAIGFLVLSMYQAAIIG
ncbi:uncharacterized protein LOC123657965 [Melitaea cinxia]|uniref:uncharacterized protein LOC123657965 n=1 Tax=Melitaea cinxia TaxID=113334 RepID=UPI001E2737BE|nr:uncharacterized protein LOC123657965 [Melitaea cinxia]